jgi:hypothetical protein
MATEERYAIVRELDSLSNTTDKTISIFKWRMFEIIEVAKTPSDFTLIWENTLSIAIVKVWLKYQIKELLKAWHI